MSGVLTYSLGIDMCMYILRLYCEGGAVREHTKPQSACNLQLTFMYVQLVHCSHRAGVHADISVAVTELEICC